MTTPYEEAIQRIRRTMAAYPDVRKPMEAIAEAMNRIERDRRDAVTEAGVAMDATAAALDRASVAESSLAASQGMALDLEASLAATVAELAVANARIASLEAAGTGGGGSGPDPLDGAEQILVHTGATLRDSLAALGSSAGLTAGGVSVLRVAGGELGPLVIGFGTDDAAWASPLLRGRTLRIVGPSSARIRGRHEAAVEVFRAAGDCRGATVEFWGVSVLGDIRVRGQSGVSVAFHGGAAVRNTHTVDETGGMVPL